MKKKYKEINDEMLAVMAKIYVQMAKDTAMINDPEWIKLRNERNAEYEKIERYKAEMRLNDLIYAKEKLEALIEEASRK